MTTGLLGRINNPEEVCYLEYLIKRRATSNISHFPLLFLEADNSSQIQKVRKESY